MIAAENITVRIGKRLLVDDLSIRIPPRKVTVLAGPNGAGKSTLLKVIAGDVQHSSGDVFLDNKPLDSWKSSEIAKRRAVLPQHSSLTFPFSVMDVVLMGRAPHIRHTETESDFRIARQSLASVGLSTFEKRLYPTLSGGERQRVQLARVLAQISGCGRNGDSNADSASNTDYGRCVLLDEPVSSLDLGQQHRVLLLARKLANEGIAVLVVLHDLNLASQYADSIALMRDGKLCAFGTPNEVLTAEVIQEVFDIPVHIMPHPCGSCPLVVTMPR